MQTVQEFCTDVACSGAHQNFYGNPGLQLGFQEHEKSRLGCDPNESILNFLRICEAYPTC